MSLTMKERNRQRRERCKRDGICQHCNDAKAREGRSTCADCGKLDSMRHPYVR